MPEKNAGQEHAPARIDDLIAGLADWRGERLAEIRRVIHETLPDVVETWKWMGSPVWERDGILAVGNAHQGKVKLTFPKGASLADPDGLFNAGLGGRSWRAIDLHEGDALDPVAFSALVRAAADLNAARR